MKKILAFTLAFVALLSISCKKETPSTPETPETPTVAKLLYNGIELQESMPLMIEVGEVATLVYEGPEGEDVTYPTSQDVLEINLEALTFKGLKEGECKITLQKKNYTIKVNPKFEFTATETSAWAGSKINLTCSWAGLEWTIMEPDALVVGKAEFINTSNNGKTADLTLPLYHTKDLRNQKPINGAITITAQAPYGKSKSVVVTSNGWWSTIANHTVLDKTGDWDEESVSVGDVIIISLSNVNNQRIDKSILQSMPLYIQWNGDAYTFTSVPSTYSSMADKMLALEVKAGAEDYTINITSAPTKQVLATKKLTLTAGN